MSKFHWSIIAFAIFMAIYFFLLTEYAYLFWGVTFAFIGLVMGMSMSIRSNFFVSAIHQLPAEEVLLTFDDGPHPEQTPRVLDVLKEKNVKAMFFLIGQNIKAYPELVERIIKEGHAIGGHSFSHEISFGFAVGKKLKGEIMKPQQLLSDFTGKDEKLFRPPFGVTNPNIARVIKFNNLTTIGWSVRSFDTIAKDKEEILNKVLGEVGQGDIVLLHDRVELTADVLGELIEGIQEKGMEIGLPKNI
ncbi:MAG: polysaccharide deacetylase family protein [Reichenbachiella sp.]